MPVTGLVIASLLAVSPPRPHAEQVLRDHCMLWAADPKNPWALAHGVKTLGPSYLASDGRRAADVIFHDFLQRNLLPDGGPGLGAPYGFVRYGKDGTPIEPHANLNTKALACDAHASLSLMLETEWGKVSLKELVESVKLGFRHVPSSVEYWKDAGWTLDLFAATQKPGAKWKAADGTTIDLDQVFDDALTELEHEDADLKAGMDKHLPQVDKRKQGVYAHSCGALHFIQGVLAWAKNPSVRKKWGKRVDDQIDILFYRLGSERRQYEAAFQQAVSTAPQYKIVILVQQLKFYGHWLETLGRLKSDLKWKPSAQQQQQINVAKAMLDSTVRQLEAEKAFENMEQFKKSQPQVYLDLIGDSCHAAHGLEAWK